jgi:alpha-D-ribose 1-methylphosphonate 5-triphosphate synthase subunit PhnL
MPKQAGTLEAMVRLAGVAKTFVLHLRDGAMLPVLAHVAFEVRAGQCTILDGPSGSGKSSILKMIFGNYRADSGTILVRDGAQWVDVASASPRRILRLRQHALGYVSQFLRTIPRVGALEIVAAAAREGGLSREMAATRAKELLERLHIPQRLWQLPPATFSGGEQQRVNIARGFAAARPILLLDEPTAALDRRNRAVVIDLVRERKRVGAAVIAICHDEDVKQELADATIDVASFRPEV